MPSSLLCLQACLLLFRGAHDFNSAWRVQLVVLATAVWQAISLGPQGKEDTILTVEEVAFSDLNTALQQAGP